MAISPRWATMAFVGIGAAAITLRYLSDDGPLPQPIKSVPIEAAPLCPWRDPENDLRILFAKATGHSVETRVLSGVRPEMARRLGRPPAPEENALRVYRIAAGAKLAGWVLTQRVSGEHGAIELVLGLNDHGAVRGLHLQGLREPPVIAAELQDPQWLNAFIGKTAASKLESGIDLPPLTPAARISAGAIASGVRSLLIIFDMSEQIQASESHSHH